MHSYQLPDNLPEPVDDGACMHLVGAKLPALSLESSSGRSLDLSSLDGLTVVYAYPMSSADDSLLPDNWDSIPGARGCTPQSCSFRDHADELAGLGARVFGLATQPPNYLSGEVARLHLPFELLSDQHLALQQALRLPVFDVKVTGSTVLKRATLICRDGEIIHVFYPVFPPDRNADQVVDWLRCNLPGHADEPRAAPARPFQPDTAAIRWKLHFRSPPDAVYQAVATSSGRSRFWAESAVEQDGVIHFVVPGGLESRGRILEAVPGRRFVAEYFGWTVTFDLCAAAGREGTDLEMVCRGVPDAERSEVIAGWVSVLMAMKAAVDFGVDLRSHDPERTWWDGYADN